MSRWHEPGCKRPDINSNAGVPFCNCCFASACQEDIESKTALSAAMPPEPVSQVQYRRNWPSDVAYKDNDQPHVESHNRSAWITKTAEISSLANVTISQCTGTGFRRIVFEDEVRLLRLHPGTSDDPIHVEFVPMRLGDSSVPAYEALSYTWADESGDVTRNCQIFLGPYWDIVWITHGCEQAISTIRHKHVDRLVWVNSICIQQEDMIEKNHQTRLLREIFQKAFKVVVYLGKATKDSSVALDFIKSAENKLLISKGVDAVDESRKRALTSLFARPYFSRLWVIQEVVQAKRLEVFCGQDSVLLPNLPLATIIPNLPAPNWFIDRTVWLEELRSKPKCEPFLQATAYICSDPRDKVFGVLGLLDEQGVEPDYTCPVEIVYVGIAAYLIKNHRAFDILAFSGAREKQYTIPSWVPDWSQKLEAKYGKFTYTLAHEDLDIEKAVIQLSNPIFFEMSMTDSEGTMKVDRCMGTLHLHGLKLFKMSGQAMKVDNQMTILMDKGEQGTLIVSIPDLAYELGEDYVFLFDGWNHPVILRSLPNTDSYMLVSVCALAIGKSPGTCFLPWSDSLTNTNDPIRVSEFSSRQKIQILAFHSSLMELCGIHFPASDDSAGEVSYSITTRVLDYVLLSQTQLQQIESRLKKAWLQFEQELGWMFLDQVALWKLSAELGENDQEFHSECGLPVEPNEARAFAKFCGLELSSTNFVSSDVRRFCASFIRLQVPQSATFPNTWTPVLSQLKSQLSKIRQWSEITEQMLYVIEWSNLFLCRSWPSTPGSDLPNKWLRHWTDFRRIVEESSGGAGSQQTKVESAWDWAEFKDHLSKRAQLWGLSLPQQLDPAANHRIAVQLGLRALGLNLSARKAISIV